MASRTGASVNREIVGGNSSNDVSDTVERARTSAAAPTLQRAVVIDVIINPNLLTDTHIEELAITVNNPRFIDIMPPNSIIAHIISNDGGHLARANTILLPFFSSHFQLPVQVGEIVQVVYDDYSHGGQQIGYWLTRTSAQRTVEDANYTHLDRRLVPQNNPSSFTSGERKSRSAEQPDLAFPNGGRSAGSFTLPQSSSNSNAFDDLLQNATSHLGEGQTIPLQTFEAVPRWSKRPQEFVIQGTNNTLIVLGEDRKGGPLGVRDETNPDAKGQAGTIDVVVGRGRMPAEVHADPNALFDGNTAPWTARNSRNTIETDKTKYLTVAGSSRLEDNINEGDPDFTRDASRLYITMQSEADVNFGITELELTKDTLPDGDNKNKILQPGAGIPGTLNKSYIVGKSDHIRLIARKQGGGEVDGTILILREGTSETDLNYMYISKEGTHIEGPKIVLGRGLADLAAAGNDPTPGGEPYIRWSKYRDTIDRLQEEIKEIKDDLLLQHNATLVAFTTLTTILQGAFASSVAVPFVPVPSLVLASKGLPAVVTTLSTQLDTNTTLLDTAQTTGKADTDASVESSASTKIFGE